MEEESDFYDVLGLRKNCSSSDVRSAYKRLAMKWHPDKCSEGGSAVSHEAKTRFQAIQEAYSVLSDEGQRFSYDVGLYDRTGEEEECEGNYGMKDFMKEMATLMTENKGKSTGGDNLEELKELFMKMLDADNSMPTSKQKFDVNDDDSSTSYMGQNFQFTGRRASHSAFGDSEASTFHMGAYDAPPTEQDKGRRRRGAG